jgi:hypothetical protein
LPGRRLSTEARNTLERILRLTETAGYSTWDRPSEKSSEDTERYGVIEMAVLGM